MIDSVRVVLFHRPILNSFQIFYSKNADLFEVFWASNYKNYQYLWKKKELFKDFAHLQIFFNFKCRDFNRGRFRGGGGVTLFFFRDLTPADQKGPHFILFWDVHLWWQTRKIFQRRLRCQYILIFWGELAPKMRFFGQNFPKSAWKHRFCGAEKLAKTGLF